MGKSVDPYTGQYIESITLKEFIDKANLYMKKNPEAARLPVYFDCLHIKGQFTSFEDYIDMF